jgi:rubrerythrin
MDIESNKTRVTREELSVVAQKLNTTPEDIENFTERASIFNNQHQQGEQYNNCTVGVPESLLAAIQESLVTTQEALRLSLELMKEVKDELNRVRNQ